MAGFLGSSFAVFLGLTVVVFGFAAFMTGQALAGTWRPAWQALPYAVLLAAANRFFAYALFAGDLLSLSGFLVDLVVLLGICLLAYRLTRTRQMVRQYPWLYVQTSPFSWRERA